MGLYASFTPEDLELPLTLDQEIEGEFLSVEVDYSLACEMFCETFLDVATDLVPVDTGYLQSTIDADTDGFFCECEALAEYAQYVEYGTWKMSAQPYFEPAVQAGLEAFMEYAQEAIDEAQEILQDMCEAVIEEMMSMFGGEEGGFMGEMFGSLVGGLMLLLLFPILVNIYGILDSIFNINGNNKNSFGGSLRAIGIDIEII